MIPLTGEICFTIHGQGSSGLLISIHACIVSGICRIQIMNHQLGHCAVLCDGELFIGPEHLVSLLPLHWSSRLAQLTAQSGRPIFGGFQVLQFLLETQREG